MSVCQHHRVAPIVVSFYLTELPSIHWVFAPAASTICQVCIGKHGPLVEGSLRARDFSIGVSQGHQLGKGLCVSVVHLPGVGLEHVGMVWGAGFTRSSVRSGVIQLVCELPRNARVAAVVRQVIAFLCIQRCARDDTPT